MLRSLLMLLIVGLLPSAVLGQSVKRLPPEYRHWLVEEVPYIISGEERSEFLRLNTDAERDAFIRTFWQARNPEAGSEINSFKEQHYLRLAYANETFGGRNAQNGWRTDMGQVYITLGPPQQKSTYLNARNVRPIEIWFYQSPSPALPSYFYVMFYKRSASEPFTLYSPYQDGPNRLITGLETENDQSRSLQQLRKSLGDEVARRAVSLLPSEPVDLTSFSPSMTSDSMLATVRGLADSPLEQQLRIHHRSREAVTASILRTGNTPETSYIVLRDEYGEKCVSYLAAFREPEPGIVGRLADGSSGYDLTFSNHILTEQGAPVYDTVSKLRGKLQPSQVEVSKQKAFAAEEQFPLVAGVYSVESTITNNLNLEAHRFTSKLVIPEDKPAVLTISQPLAYSGPPVHILAGETPFAFASIRFSPQGTQIVSLHAGDPLPCVFQIWLPKSIDGIVSRSPIEMRFYYGSVTAGGRPMDETTETVETANADKQGNLVTGHVFHTTGLMVGSYRVIIAAAQAGAPTAYAALVMRIVPKETPVGHWSAYGPQAPEQTAQKRQLAAAAIGRK